MSNDVSLRRGSAGFWHVLAEGLMSNGPLASTTVALTAAAAYGLGSTPMAYLIGIIVVAFWINTPFQYSKRLASATTSWRAAQAQRPATWPAFPTPSIICF